MSMLYVWNPWLSDDKSQLELVLTRGDSDRVGAGSKRFVAGIARAVGVSAEPQRWSVQSYRCNYYSEYWQENGWESKWDYIWRLCVHFAGPVSPPTLMRTYVGTDEIDDYSAQLESYKQPPFKCLVVGAFHTEKQARSAAGKIADDKEIHEAGRKVSAPEPVIDVYRLAAGGFQLRAEIGAGDEGFFTGGYPDRVVSMLEASGGMTHAEN